MAIGSIKIHYSNDRTSKCCQRRQIFTRREVRIKIRLILLANPNNFAMFKFYRLIASASFDKSVRLWRANDGHFICTFRGHVQAVYTIAWSVDSRLLVTGSKDSTLKGNKYVEDFTLIPI